MQCFVASQHCSLLQNMAFADTNIKNKITLCWKGLYVDIRNLTFTECNSCILLFLATDKINEDINWTSVCELSEVQLRCSLSHKKKWGLTIAIREWQAWLQDSMLQYSIEDHTTCVVGLDLLKSVFRGSFWREKRRDSIPIGSLDFLHNIVPTNSSKTWRTINLVYWFICYKK